MHFFWCKILKKCTFFGAKSRKEGENNPQYVVAYCGEEPRLGLLNSNIIKHQSNAIDYATILYKTQVLLMCNFGGANFAFVPRQIYSCEYTSCIRL